MHPLALTRSIVDPIHGLVRMTQEEHLVMNSRIFQRLRRIKQNGLLHLVFPSATHNRFEHSLGVMFVADRVLQALLVNSQAASGRLVSVHARAPDRAVDLTHVRADVLKDIFRVTRLAALVHDLGHGPLSHTFDGFAPRRGFVAALLDAPQLAAIAPLRRELLAHAAAGADADLDGPIGHEAMSCLLFAAIWHELRGGAEPWIPRAVAAAIAGPKLVGDAAALPGDLRPWLGLVHDIVSSAPVDADRMDYMERDSRSCGVSYGLFDADRVLKSALCFQDGEGGSYRLGWKFSGLRAIEVFVQARFQLYVQVYGHKTNHAANLMMKAIAAHAREHKIRLFREDDLGRLIEEYCLLSDDYFLMILAGRVDGRLRGASEIHAIARDVEARRLWKRIYERAGAGPSAEKVLKNMRKRTWSEGLDLRALAVDRSDPGATKGLADGAVLLRRDEAGIYRASRKDDWLALSPMIRALHEEGAVERLYWRGPERHAGELRRVADAIAAR